MPSVESEVCGQVNSISVQCHGFSTHESTHESAYSHLPPKYDESSILGIYVKGYSAA